MNSKYLLQSGFSGSVRLKIEGEQNFEKIPIKAAVYALVYQKLFRRLKGNSDIIYIGSTFNRRGLRKRIRQFLHPGPTQTTSIRVNALIREIGSVAVYWRLMNKRNVRKKEKSLLKKYYNDHRELPPLNMRF